MRFSVLGLYLSMYVVYYFYLNSNVRIIIYLKVHRRLKKIFVLFCTPKNVKFSEKGPEIGFSCLFSKNANWLRLFHQTVLDENKGTLILLTVPFISKSSAQQSKFINFGKKAPK